jgi:hypothetical protein
VRHGRSGGSSSGADALGLLAYRLRGESVEAPRMYSGVSEFLWENLTVPGRGMVAGQRHLVVVTASRKP